MSDSAPPVGTTPDEGSSPAEVTSPESRVDPETPGIPRELAAALHEVEALRTRVEKERRKRKKVEKKQEGSASLGSSRGIETMFRTSYRTHIDLSNLADNKANIMISINGIIISILLASISPKMDANPWLLVPTSVLLIGCLFSLVYAVFAARPRVSSRPTSLATLREDEANILFFGNFVNMPEEEFVEGMKELMTHTDELYLNMVRDIYSLGTVLARKFRLLRTSYNVFIAGLVLGVALFLGVFAFVAVVSPPVVVP
ncbi:MAG: hypothetical protein KJP18_17845 [Gemmatimonadetes bacterium]|nr:hypothetical protein [Gemmatimonadota bacterium]NNK63562.1 hypothetical protein [Gemmatimonadota bacterium]